jgi:hypothetical protein
MALSVIFFVIAILIITILLALELKKMKHKLFAILLIALILFGFFSFNTVFKDKEVKIETISDVGNVVKLYFSWLGTAFNNVKVITTQAIKMDWQGNSTSLA